MGGYLSGATKNENVIDYYVFYRQENDPNYYTGSSIQWTPYKESENNILNKFYINGNKSCILGEYEILFDKNTQINITSFYKQRPIKFEKNPNFKFNSRAKRTLDLYLAKDDITLINDYTLTQLKEELINVDNHYFTSDFKYGTEIIEIRGLKMLTDNPIDNKEKVKLDYTGFNSDAGSLYSKFGKGNELMIDENLPEQIKSEVLDFMSTYLERESKKYTEKIMKMSIDNIFYEIFTIFKEPVIYDIFLKMLYMNLSKEKVFYKKCPIFYVSILSFYSKLNKKSAFSKFFLCCNKQGCLHEDLNYWNQAYIKILSKYKNEIIASMSNINDYKEMLRSEIVNLLFEYINEEPKKNYKKLLKEINRDNIFDIIFKMYKVDSFLYKAVDHILRTKDLVALQNIQHFYYSMLAAFTYFNTNKIKELNSNELIVYRGSKISKEEKGKIIEGKR
jgi:hypothetical protein